MWQRLWREETGSVNSAELMLIMTLMCIGMLVGIKSLRDANITEFADLGQAISNLNQSYSFASSEFIDTQDFCDLSIDEDEDGPSAFNSKCVSVAQPATSEGGGP